MDIKNANNLDLRLGLLAGDSVHAGNFKVEPLTLLEIKDFGYLNYNRLLGVIMLKREDLISEDIEELRQYSLFELILYSENESMIGNLTDALCFFLKEDKDDIIVNPEFGIVFNASAMSASNMRVVNHKNFDDIAEIIKYQNCVKNSNEVIEVKSALSEKAKQIADKLKKYKEVVNTKKAEKDAGTPNDIDFADIVSAVSTKSNTYNKHTIWNATIYQLYDEYKRLEMISGYETSILAMVNGAKIDNLQHWSAKIEE